MSIKQIRDLTETLAKIESDERSARPPRWWPWWPLSIHATYTRKRHALIDAKSMPPSLDQLHTIYRRADALAYWYQKKTYATLWALFFAFGLCGAVAFEIHAHMPGDYHAWRGVALAAYLFLWVLIACVYLRARQKHYQENFRSYRALAEGLRVQFFWLLVGIPEPIARNFEPRDPEATLPVLKTVEELADGPRQELRHRTIDMAFTGGLALDHWVKDQERYYKRTAEKEETKLKTRRAWEIFFFGLALALAFGLMLAQFVSAVGFPVRERVMRLAPVLAPATWEHVTIVASAVAMVWAGLLHGYLEKRAYREHIETYHRMHDVFEQCRNALESGLDSHAMEGAFRDLGKVALGESTEWVRLHRWRPLEPPRG